MKRTILVAIFSLILLPCFSQTEIRKLINENKVWEYFTRYSHSGIELRTYTHYKFDGVKEEFGKMYHRWVILDKEDYINAESLTPEKEIWSFSHRELNEEVALLREEDGKIYMLLDRDEITVFDPSNEHKALYSKVIEPGEEILLYDFNVSADDSYTSIVNDDLLDTIIITGKNIIINSDIEYTEYTFFNTYSLWYYTGDIIPLPDYFFEDEYYEKLRMKMVEGLGLVYGGTLTDFFPDYDRQYECSCFYRTSLSNVTDNNGKILFQSSTPPRPIISEADIHILSNTSPNTPIYDLFGREIRKPQPGTIYIRNGKKFIAK